MALPAWNCIFNTKKCDFLQLVVTLGCNPGSKSSPLYNQLNCSDQQGPKAKLSFAGNQLVRGHFCKNETHKIHDFWKYFQPRQRSFIHIVFMTSQWLFRKLPMTTSRIQFWLLRLWKDEKVPTIGTSSSLLVTTHLTKICPSVISASFLPQFLGGQDNNLPTNIFEKPSRRLDTIAGMSLRSLPASCLIWGSLASNSHIAIRALPRQKESFWAPTLQKWEPKPWEFSMIETHH